MRQTEPQTLSELLMQYLTNNTRIESSTRVLVKLAFRKLQAAVGDITPRALSLSDCENFQRSILDRGCNAVSANIYIKQARPVLRWALRNGWISEDPFRYIKLHKVPVGEVRVYESAEFERLLTACRSRLWQARLLLAKTAALRRGEILNLTVRDIDFQRGVITVRPKKEDRQHWRWQPKGKAIRHVPLVPVLAEFLERYVLVGLQHPYLMLRPERYSRIMQLRSAGDLDDRIRKCPDENWGKPFGRIRRYAGVDEGTFHDLRRTCITEWLEGGLQPHEVRKLAGHASIETTMRYYVATRRALLDRARAQSQKVIGATGLEPATS